MFRTVGRAFWVCTLLAVFSACGGDGGDGGGAVYVTPTSLTFTATPGGPAPAAQSIHVHQKNTSLVYGSSFDHQPSWVRETSFAMIDSSRSDFDHVFAVTTTDLEPGTYTATYRIVIHEPGPPYSGTGPYIPGDLVDEKTVLLTYVVTAP
jgi:hypothetical protein